MFGNSLIVGFTETFLLGPRSNSREGRGSLALALWWSAEGATAWPHAPPPRACGHEVATRESNAFANGRDPRLRGAVPSARTAGGPESSTSGRRGVLAGTWATSQVTSPSILHARTLSSRPSDRIPSWQLTDAGILYAAVVQGTTNRQGEPRLLRKLVATRC